MLQRVARFLQRRVGWLGVRLMYAHLWLGKYSGYGPTTVIEAVVGDKKYGYGSSD